VLVLHGVPYVDTVVESPAEDVPSAGRQCARREAGAVGGLVLRQLLIGPQVEQARRRVLRARRERLTRRVELNTRARSN